MPRPVLMATLTALGLGLLFAGALPFMLHSVWRGGAALQGNSVARGYLGGTGLSDIAIFGHMITGALITGLAFVQWAGPIRHYAPKVHRLSGRLLAGLALVTGIAGLVYISMRGTIGGTEMNLGFSVYGALVALCAVQTARFAWLGETVRHRRWGTRLIILCLGSWLYRVHYELFFTFVCDGGRAGCPDLARHDFRGVFDRVQNFAFYLPYLAMAELWMRWRPNRSA